jgi:hypothetical protein
MNVNIQYQDVTGSWYTVSSCLNEGSYIIEAMKSASNFYSGCRIRAIDENGRIVDIL